MGDSSKLLTGDGSQRKGDACNITIQIEKQEKFEMKAEAEDISYGQKLFVHADGTITITTSDTHFPRRIESDIARTLDGRHQCRVRNDVNLPKPHLVIEQNNNGVYDIFFVIMRSGARKEFSESCHLKLSAYVICKGWLEKAWVFCGLSHKLYQHLPSLLYFTARCPRCRADFQKDSLFCPNLNKSGRCLYGADFLIELAVPSSAMSPVRDLSMQDVRNLTPRDLRRTIHFSVTHEISDGVYPDDPSGFNPPGVGRYWVITASNAEVGKREVLSDNFRVYP